VLETLNVGTYDITVTKYTPQDGGADTEENQSQSNVVIAEGENPAITFTFT